jgi:hypothetical protein
MYHGGGKSTGGFMGALRAPGLGVGGWGLGFSLRFGTIRRTKPNLLKNRDARGEFGGAVLLQKTDFAFRRWEARIGAQRVEDGIVWRAGAGVGGLAFASHDLRQL